MRISTFKIECIRGQYLEEKCAIICELPGNLNLEELCDFTLDGFYFWNDRCHEFYVAASVNNFNKYVYKNGETKLSDIFPIGERKHLFLRFDFDVNWVFKIIPKLQILHSEKTISSPILIERIGTLPEQYLDYED